MQYITKYRALILKHLKKILLRYHDYMHEIYEKCIVTMTMNCYGKKIANHYKCSNKDLLLFFYCLRAIWPKGYQCRSFEKSHQNSNYLKTSNMK